MLGQRMLHRMLMLDGGTPKPGFEEVVLAFFYYHYLASSILQF
jgi:hypothetical protein